MRVAWFCSEFRLGIRLGIWCSRMEMRNIIKNQERVIEELMLNILNIKIENEEVAEVAEVLKSKRN